MQARHPVNRSHGNGSGKRADRPMMATLAGLATWWCRTFHDRITRPGPTHYTCLECGRMYATPWADVEPSVSVGVLTEAEQ